MGEMNKTFADGINKVMEEVAVIRSKVGKEIQTQNNTLTEFKHGMDRMLEATKGASKLVGINDDKVQALKD